MCYGIHFMSRWKQIEYAKVHGSWVKDLNRWTFQAVTFALTFRSLPLARGGGETEGIILDRFQKPRRDALRGAPDGQLRKTIVS